MNELQTGKISFRIFKLSRPLPEDVLTRFQESGVPTPPMEHNSSSFGWRATRHLLDRDITEDNAYPIPGKLSLTLVEASRVIPSSILKAEIAQEELIHLNASDREFLSRKERQEIKQQVITKLMADMPITLKGTTFLMLDDETLVATCTSDLAGDVFCLHFRQVTGSSLIMQEPYAMDPDLMMAADTCFASDHSSSACQNAGMDFLTWLWWMAESNGGVIRDQGSEVAILVEGPLHFSSDGQGAHEAVLKNGSPTKDEAATACMRFGGKLSKAKISLSVDGQVFSAVIDYQFTIRSLHIPPHEDRLDPVSAFEDRVIKLMSFLEVLGLLFRLFSVTRKSPDGWSSVRASIELWIKERD